MNLKYPFHTSLDGITQLGHPRSAPTVSRASRLRVAWEGLFRLVPGFLHGLHCSVWQLHGRQCVNASQIRVAHCGHTAKLYIPDDIEVLRLNNIDASCPLETLSANMRSSASSPTLAELQAASPIFCKPATASSSTRRSTASRRTRKSEISGDQERLRVLRAAKMYLDLEAEWAQNDDEYARTSGS